MRHSTRRLPLFGLAVALAVLAALLVVPPIPEADAQSNITVQFSGGGTGTSGQVGYNAREGDSARVKLTFSPATTSQTMFTINTNAGTATAAADFIDGPHTCTVPSGRTTHVCNIPVVADNQIEDYEDFTVTLASPPPGFTLGSASTANVQIVNVSVVPDNWSLKPSGMNPGDQFRLLFKSGNERNGSPTAIADYDTWLRNRPAAHPWHADAQPYRDTFRTVGSTQAVNAAWHTATGIMVSGQPSHTPFSHAVHWLNGPKIADDYNDFWDGSWDTNTSADQRHADGLAATNTRGPNTGTRTGATHATAGVKVNNHWLGANYVRWGKGGGDPTGNPINAGGSSNIAKGNNTVYIAMSGIFEVESGDAANPTISVAATQPKVTEGDTIRFTVMSQPPPTTQKSVSITVDETTSGGRNFVPASDRGDRTVIVPANTATVIFTVRTEDNDLGERDGGVTVTVNDGTGYDPDYTQDTASTVIESEEEFNELSAGVRLGNGNAGPAQTGANVDFTFSLPEPLAERGLHGIRTELAWGGDVLSPRSDHRPTTWDRDKVNPRWKPDNSVKVSRHGVYVRPWLENSILAGEQSFDLRVHVKNSEEAGGAVGDGWIAMRSVAGSNIAPHPTAGWACMPVGGGACPSAWPGVPVVTVVALDNGSVMSGEDARFRVSVSPAPGAGETRRVYLKTWEVFIEGVDPPCARFGDFAIPVGRPNSRYLDWDPYKHCDPPPRNKARKVQFTAYTHVDVGSGGSAVFTTPTKVFRADPRNITGRDYWAEVQDDVAYSVGGGAGAEVETTVFDPAAAACWYGHSHRTARLITVDGEQVYAPAGMGISDCLTKGELEQQSFGFKVWTSCKVDYGHSHHPYSDSRGGAHSHHNHSPYLLRGDGTCANPQMQTRGQNSEDQRQDDDPFPDPGAVGFSDVTAGSMTLSWSQRDVDHYLVYWGENVENSDVQHAQVDAGTLTYTITGLKADTEYAVIVYSQDYDEVTPTAYQRTAAAAAASCDQSTAGAAIERARAAFAWHISHGSDAPLFWRILNTLGADNLPAKPSGVTADTISAADVRSYSAGRSWPGWTPIVEALEDCEASTGTDTTDTTDTVVPPPPTPEVSISAGSGIIEGGVATFTISADPSPSAAVDVTVSVSATGDYGVTVGQRTVTIPTSGSATLSVATSDDSVDESDGSVTVTINSGTGYDVSSGNGAATVAVSDDDDPPPPPKPVNSTPTLSISDASGSEGDTITFTVTLSPSSSRYVWVNYYARPAYGAATSANYADFVSVYGTLTFNPGETSKTIAVSLTDDSHSEGDETFVFSLYGAVQAKLSDREAVGTIIDND